MSRVVFELGAAVGPNGRPYMSLSIKEPPRTFGIPDVAFTCAAGDSAFLALQSPALAKDAVKQAGTALFEALGEHPEVKHHLITALGAPVGQRSPVYVEIAQPGAETLPWETLCSPTTSSYLGLDERWSLGRMVTPQSQSQAFFTLTPPLRIVALLSCLGVPAAGELDALRTAVKALGPGQAKLLVFASEEALVDAVDTEIAAGTANEIYDIRLVPGELRELQEVVAEFAPHVLHLFCHGSAVDNPHVRLAVKSSWQDAANQGLFVETSDFRHFCARTDSVPWLVVLNCCDTAAAATDDVQSLALGLALAGFAPAVIGMREPVGSATANLVTSALYGGLVAELSGRIAAPSTTAQPLDWARLVVGARERLTGGRGMTKSAAAASTKEWTLPVVYVRPEEFQLQVVSAPAHRPRVGRPHERLDPAPGVDRVAAGEQHRAVRLEIEGLQRLLGSLPPGQAHPLRTEATERIQELAAQLGLEPGTVADA